MMNRLMLAIQLLWILAAVLVGAILFYLIASAVITRWLGF